MRVLEVRFDAEAHSADAIQRAAYKFSDRLSLDLRCEPSEFLCSLTLTDESAQDADAIVADFRTEVLDQVLRERIRQETEGVRNLILSIAFSQADLHE